MGHHVHPMTKWVITLFWAIFWTLNGLDKFFNSETFFGENFSTEFIEDFAILGLSSELAMIAFYVVAIFELVLAGSFVILLFMQHVQRGLLLFGYYGILLLLTLFCAGSILFGQRDELLEHAIYFLIAVVTFELVLMRPTETEG